MSGRVRWPRETELRARSASTPAVAETGKEEWQKKERGVEAIGRRNLKDGSLRVIPSMI